MLAIIHLQQLHLCRRQVAVGGQHVKPGFTGRLNHLPRGHLMHQDIVNAVFQGMLVDTAAHGGIALWVEIHQQDALAHGGQRGRQVDAGRGFADAALLVSYRDNPSH